MSDEPSLPPLPAVSWDKQSQSVSFSSRKRGRSNHQAGDSSPLLFNSSDPAVFSSDDDPGLDNYVEGRPKKRYVGTWFQQRLATDDAPNTLLQQTKRTLTRDYDSGVFLGSDGTTDTDCGDHLNGLKLPARPRPHPIRLSQAEMAARQKIEDCLEKCNESVDLWSMGLEELSDGAVERLSQIVNIPNVTKDVAFMPREPELKVFLSLNRLSRLPGSIFDVTNLVVLSLRGNQLTELPPAICKLRNLTQLNLSHNNISHLPAELLDLLQLGRKLSDLTLLANPFVRPQGCIESLVPKVEGNAETFSCPGPNLTHRYERPIEASAVPRYLTRWLGRSPVQFCDSRGQALSDFHTALDSEISVLPVEVSSNKIGLAATYSPQASTRLRGQETKPSAVPSLLEMALRSCYRSSQLPDLEFYIPEAPDHLQKLLRRASLQKDMGGLVCSNCRKTLIMPPMQWVEWRELRTSLFRRNAREEYEVHTSPYTKDASEIAVPFLYRACSWNCGPKDLEKDKGWNMPEGCKTVKSIRPGYL